MSPRNIDGGLHDEEVFAIGDDREDDELEDEIFDADEEENNQISSNATPIPGPVDPQSAPEQSRPEPPKGDQGDAERPLAPSKYYIKPGDTLLGIALRFGINVRTGPCGMSISCRHVITRQGHHLCRMNSLPPSTLRTTPHLLHTRTFLILPPNARIPQSSNNSQEQSDHDTRRERERAEKRLQVLTKEVDWRVAKAYVALADADPNVDEEADLDYESKMVGKEKNVRAGTCQGGETLEGKAIDRYLDDEEWEQRERREGRDVSIPRFPLSRDPWNRNTERGEGGLSSWWRRKK